MDVSTILDSLNEAQREAVTAPLGPIRVLAGAGSGKTRVLVQRIAWLLAVENATPWSILAVTFTNKAAAEVRERVKTQLTHPSDGLWIGTFHGIAHRLLRIHAQEAKLPKDFQILDSDDQLRLIKRVIRSLELDEKKWEPRQAANFINHCKDTGKRPHHLPDQGDRSERQWVQIYQAYQVTCDRSGLVDFGELLLRCHETLRDQKELLAHYQQRFQHLLVDEFQDTNTLQYAWLRLLSGTQGDVFIVGDDDQSIYGWRGAKVENIQRFDEDFAGTSTIRLEQNYRSSGTILDAANALIAHNKERLGKHLWTDSGNGEPIGIYNAFDDSDEAGFVVDRAREWIDGGGQLADIAVLYRSNAQSRSLEDALIGAQIPYRVYGGLRFFERAEIKDALAYLRLCENRDDDASFERVINLPARGLGERSVETIRHCGREHSVSLWRAAQRIAAQGLLKGKSGRGLSGFLQLVDTIDQQGRDLPLSLRIEQVVKDSGLFDYHQNSKDPRSEDRIENLEELVNAAAGFQFAAEDYGEELEPLAAFLAHAVLEASEGQASNWEDGIQMMTMHMAKGLEFPVVFLVGVEEGLFPNSRSVHEPGRLEEERRLAYVGLTRAQQQVYISFAERRFLHGREHYPSPSRFISEIPEAHYRFIRAATQVQRPQLARSAEFAQDDEFTVGATVSHPQYGEGMILQREGDGQRTRVRVEFGEGTKWLVLAYAKLTAA